MEAQVCLAPGPCLPITVHHLLPKTKGSYEKGRNPGPFDSLNPDPGSHPVPRIKSMACKVAGSTTSNEGQMPTGAHETQCPPRLGPTEDPRSTCPACSPQSQPQLTPAPSRALRRRCDIAGALGRTLCWGWGGQKAGPLREWETRNRAGRHPSETRRWAWT